MKHLVFVAAILFATEARAQRLTETECAAFSGLTTIVSGVLTVPFIATNLGMGLGAALGSSRGVGIGAVVTGGLGVFASIVPFYFAAALAYGGCNLVGPVAFGATSVAMGGFAIGFGIWRIIASSRPKLQAFNPWMMPVIDERQRAITGAMGGLSFNLN